MVEKEDYTLNSYYLIENKKLISFNFILISSSFAPDSLLPDMLQS